MKNKAEALALELEFLELDAEQEEIEAELDKNTSKRRKGLIIILLGIFFPSITILFKWPLPPFMVIFYIFLLSYGLILREVSEKIVIKRKMKKNRAKIWEVKKSLLHLKYEE